MKHAGRPALERIGSLLEEVRRFEELKERKLGIFYRKSAAFLHFHEDPQGLFADLKAGDRWDRLPINSLRERARLIARIRQALRTTPPAP